MSRHRRNVVLSSLLACLVVSLCGLGAQDAVAAVARPKVTVSATTAVVAGDVVTIRGAVTLTASGSRVRLQNLRGRTWRTVASASVVRGGFSFRVRPTATAPRYRVLRPQGYGRAQAVSRTLAFAVSGCDRGSVPVRKMATAFTRPSSRAQRTALTTTLRHLVCASAPRATIRLSMYFLVLDAKDTAPIFDAMDLVHRARGVTVRILLDDKGYVNGANAATVARIKKFASLDLCHQGCRSERAGTGINHQKFITISDTLYSSAVEPVLWSSSANLSTMQFHDWWQSAVTVFGDPYLTREFNIRWESMRPCAVGRGGCTRWSRTFGGKALSATTYRPLAVQRIWVDPNLGSRRGSQGRGTSVVFSPLPPGVDNLLDELRGVTCTPHHRTVRLSTLVAPRSRGRAIAAVLAGLRASGCDVRIILDRPQSADQRESVASMRAAGVPTTCVSGVHDKVMLLDGTSPTGTLPRLVTVTGSENLSRTSVAFNDESTLRISTLGLTGAARSDAGAVYTSYLQNWNRMAAAGVSCS